MPLVHSRILPVLQYGIIIPVVLLWAFADVRGEDFEHDDANIVRWRLKNGVNVVVNVRPGAPVVSMYAVWAGGVRAENRDNNGITQLLARMLSTDCGNHRKSSEALKAVARAGKIRGIATRNTFGLSAEWPVHFWREGLSLLADSVLIPCIAAESFARERELLITDIVTRDRIPSFAAFRLFREALYRQHPYRMDPVGSVPPLVAMNVSDLDDFYQDHFPVSGLTLAVVGNVDITTVDAEVRRSFGAVSADSKPHRSPPPEPFFRRGVHPHEVYRYMGHEQAHLVIGFPGATLHDPDRFPLEVVAMLLSGPEGRLQTGTVGDCNRAGTAVSTVGLERGYFAIFISCWSGAASDAVRAIRAELDSIANRPVAPGELQRAKRALVARHESARSHNSSFAWMLAFYELHGSGYQQALQYRHKINQVHADDVRQVASEYINWSDAVIATVKPIDLSPAAAQRAAGVRKRLRQRR